MTAKNMKYIVKNKKYILHYNKDGEAQVDWKNYSQYSDECGFDIRNTEKNGKHYIKMLLPYGTYLIRYGKELGRYLASENTEYNQLSLPYIKESVDYHKYKVIVDDFKLYLLVDKGIAAPAFGCQGGGVQYHIIGHDNIATLLQNKILEEVADNE